ncbi:oligosaccharide flippase family protein [Providencia rettgeri]|uniref:oligosaccharide flippase family protein n=1 Tax=Providencia sp. PROV137 TaxID=2949847 RepID=UPI00234BF330|nr:oligosaccharide flippase family protein [Providencia sp. PROV137]ELR5109035.1 oligosaccharide flippase family protein [Providencia rettgeri]ELR5284245.1 oligosaccharide flippase family protein [Providencia rettgeri]
MLFKLIASSFILRLFNILAMAIGTFLLARILEPEQFGIYSLVISYVAVIIIPIQAGLPILSVRTISSNANGKIPFDLITFSINIVVKYFLIIIFIDALINLLFPSPISNFRFLFYLLSIATLGLSITSGYIQGINHILQSQYIEQLFRPILFIILIVVILLFKEVITFNYELALMMLSLSYIISFLVSIYYINSGGYCNKDIHTSKQKKIWLKSLIPLSSLTGLQVLLNQMDVIFLAQLQDYSSVAVYKIAAQFSIVVTLISTVVGVIIAPKINKLYTENTNELKKIIYYSNWISLISGSIIVLFYYFFSEYIIIYLLGIEYKNASLYLLILCVGYLISTFFGPISTIVNMLSLEKLNLYSIVIAVVSNFILLSILIPILSTLGAAISTALSIIIWKASLSYLVKDKIKFSCYLKI